jgi:predicted permease
MRAGRDALHGLHADVLARVRAVPGVLAAAEAAVVPVSGNSWGNNVWMDGAESAPGNALFNRVSRDYFATLGIPLVAGRDVTDTDTLGLPPVAIVNDTFVRTVANGVNPIGRRMILEATPNQPETAYEIVGIVRDAKYVDLRQEPYPGVFLAAGQAQRPGEYARLVVRSALPPAAVTAGITEAIRLLNPAIVVSFTVLETQVLETLVRERLMATLSGFFGLLAALIATIGLYGVMSYMVSRRKVEIGIRMALGADPRKVVRMVIGESSLLLLFGVAIGTGLAVLSSRWAATLLFGLKPWDPASLVVAVLVLGTVSLLAAWIPARRASRLTPTIALREE